MLTDAACKAAKPKLKPYKLSDSGGLYLEVMPNAAKYWRLKYRFLNKEKRLAFGVYPFVSLSEARDYRDIAKKVLKSGLDPSEVKKSTKREKIKDTTTTFKIVGLEWYELNEERWSENYRVNVKRILNNDLFPDLGSSSLAQIEAPNLLTVLKKIEKRGAIETTTRARKLCSQIFRYGIQTGKCKYNPMPDLSGAFKRREVKHMATIEKEEIPLLIDAIEKNDACLSARTRRAIRLSLLTFVRPGELRQANKSEIDLEKEQWTIPGVRMKKRQDHIVPLSKQALAIFKEQIVEVEDIKTGRLFPNQKDPIKAMSDSTVRMALQRLGFEDRMTPHGFRALARTTIREELEYEPDVIEVQLAHKPKNSLGNAYDRSKFLKQRKQMMQDWANYVDRIYVEYKEKQLRSAVCGTDR